VEDNLERDLARIAQIDIVPSLLQVLCKLTGLGFAAIARVTETRWIACAVRDEIAFGLQAGGELEVATTLCQMIRATHEPIIIDYVAADERYCGHPAPQRYGFQSYISIPIFLRNGAFFGTLCALDPKPAVLRTPEIEGLFKLFADLIAFHLDAVDRVTQSQRALLDAQHASELREQFIAVLGHDLRSPLAAINASATVLERAGLGEREANMATLIKRSATRMATLISDVMDLARGRLGGGVPIAALPQVHMTPVLEQVIQETRASNPSYTIESQIELQRAMNCDAGRIAQLAANLLGNAVVHGDSAYPIRVIARIENERFELSVINTGETIPDDVRKRLFEPFYRASVSPNQQGLGLGLYIAAEIAKAHEGGMAVESVRGRTQFTFSMPVSGPEHHLRS
jgi:signal transduction histidine kinase